MNPVRLTLSLLGAGVALLAVPALASAEAPSDRAVCDHIAKLSAADGETMDPEDLAECVSELPSLKENCPAQWEEVSTCLVSASSGDKAGECLMICIEASIAAGSDAAGMGGSPPPAKPPTEPIDIDASQLERACANLAKAVPEAGDPSECVEELPQILQECPAQAEETLVCLETATGEDAAIGCVMKCAMAAADAGGFE